MIRAIIVLFLALLGASAASDREQQAFHHFLAWYKTYTGSPMPPDVLRAYSVSLAADGLAPDEVKARIEDVQKMASASPAEMLVIHFNNVFSNHRELFRNEPNAFLARMCREWKPGKALDVGMGQGRNAVYLAQQGWDVTGYDISDEGLAVARHNAEAAGVKIKAIQSSHQTFDFGKEQWDLIVMTYSFVNMSDSSFVQRVRESLKPNGIVFVEQANSGGTGKGPRNALLQTFSDLRVVYYEDAVDTAEWGLMKQRIGRIVAIKE